VELRQELRLHHLAERVVEGAEVGVDLVGQGTRQEAEALPRFDGRASEDDPIDILPLQRLHGFRHGEVGLSGAGRADPEHDRVRVDGVDVFFLAEGLRTDALPARGENRRAETDGGARAAVITEHTGARHDLGGREIAALADHHEEFVDQAPGSGDLRRLAGERNFVAADVHADGGVFLLDRAE